MKRKPKKAAKPVGDTIQAGCGVTLFGQQWLVTEMSYVGHFENGGMTLTLGLEPFGERNPILYYYNPPVIKPKRKRRKAKKK
jgi:hypothetical protein